MIEVYYESDMLNDKLQEAAVFCWGVFSASNEYYKKWFLKNIKTFINPCKLRS